MRQKEDMKSPRRKLMYLYFLFVFDWGVSGKSQLIRKDPDAGKDWGQEEKGMTEDEMVGWHY